MATKNEYGFDRVTNRERWLINFETLKAQVLETGHFPNKHDK